MGLKLRRFKEHGNHPERGVRRRRGRLEPLGDFQEQKDERFLARDQDLLREETGLRFPQREAQMEQFGENWLDDGGPVLVDV
ncbi:MAG: hypothetical protein HPY51_17180 [Candidatus Omnitrophica bacterium]|nr:hypothetical protein [Candidatus Omnitrophota bacterium]